MSETVSGGWRQGVLRVLRLMRVRKRNAERGAAVCLSLTSLRKTDYIDRPNEGEGCLSCTPSSVLALFSKWLEI